MKTVLLVDDEPEILDLLTYLFKQFNYEVITFNQIIPVETIRELNPDVVVLDNNLGKKTGGDLCLEVKNEPDLRHIPVVLLSVNEKLPQIAKNSCADAFLEKPFDIGALLNTIRRVMVLEA